MDLAYKRVKGCYYEFVIASYDENFKRREFKPFPNQFASVLIYFISSGLLKMFHQHRNG